MVDKLSLRSLASASWACLVAGIFALLTAPTATAQVDPSISFSDWQEKPHYADTRDEIIVQGRSKTDTGVGASIWSWYSQGRVKADRESSDPNLFFGYKLDTVSATSNDPRIATGYNDIAIVGAGYIDGLFEGLGEGVGESGKGVRLFLTAGAGTANDNHFTTDDSFYALAGVGIEMPLADGMQLHAGVHHDGNRLLYPDVPLPYAAVGVKFSDDLHAELGLPRSRVTYNLHDMVELTAEWNFPVNVRVEARHWIIKQTLAVAFLYEHRVNAFTLTNAGTTRAFYKMQRIQGGINWKTEWFDMQLGGGYAFDQRFEAGRDLRSMANIFSLSDEPYLFFSIGGTFP